MRKNKTERTLKVYTQPGHLAPRPAIWLQGKWVEELGFNIGDKCSVKCSKGHIVITKLS